MLIISQHIVFVEYEGCAGSKKLLNVTITTPVEMSGNSFFKFSSLGGVLYLPDETLIYQLCDGESEKQ